MEFLTDLKLLPALSFAGKAVSSRPSHPVLSGVLIAATGSNQVSFSGFNLSIGARVTIEADVSEPGSIVVPYRYLKDIVSRLDSKTPMHFSIEGERVLVLKSGTGVYRFNCYDPEEFPALFKVDDDSQLTITGKILSDCLEVAYATSSEDSKGVLQGISLSKSKSGAKFAATDGHRLVVKEYKTSDELGSIESLIIPGDVHKFLHYIDPTDEVTIAYGRGMASLTWGNHELTTRLLDGAYPNYEQLFPTSFERSVTFDKKPAMEAIDRVTVLDPAGGKVMLNIEYDRIVFSLPDMASESIDAKLEGESIEMCMNPRYLLEAMKYQEGETILFRCNSPTTAVVITGDSPQETIEQRNLLMPMGNAGVAKRSV